MVAPAFRHPCFAVLQVLAAQTAADALLGRTARVEPCRPVMRVGQDN
jgi:hypothetical protein